MPRDSVQKPRTQTSDAKPPRPAENEKATLAGFLDYLRDAIAAKATGTPEPQVRTSAVTSGTTVLGLVKHLAAVERFYFLGQNVEDWAATMRPSPDETVEGLLAEYRDAVARANEVIDACADLSQPAPRPPGRRSAMSMRWLLTHMIEETGRHAGHADILRELIDDSTGR